MSKWDVKNIAAQENIAPNLIPMVDIMFLLLLFLMLGSDMGQRELEELNLSKATHVEEDKAREGMVQEDRLTINVYHLPDSGMVYVKCDTYAKHETCRNPEHWKIAVRGVDYRTADDARFKALLKMESDLGKKNPRLDKFSERKIMLRADGSAPYSLVQSVMYSCSFAGMYKIECGAAKLPKGEVIAEAR
jgi:biopolymer transport protein ExbD